MWRLRWVCSRISNANQLLSGRQGALHAYLELEPAKRSGARGAPAGQAATQRENAYPSGCAPGRFFKLMLMEEVHFHQVEIRRYRAE